MPVPEPPDLHRLLVRTGRAVERAGRAGGPGSGSTARAVLAHVAAYGACAHRDLAVALGVAPTTVTAAVDGLERCGDVVRVRDGRDRRVVRVELTGRGRARLADRPTGALPDPPAADAEVVRRYLVSVLAALGDVGGSGR